MTASAIPMSATLTALGIDRMSDEERLALAKEILATVPESKMRAPLSPEVKAMLRERIQDAKDNPDDYITLEEFEVRVKDRFGS